LRWLFFVALFSVPRLTLRGMFLQASVGWTAKKGFMNSHGFFLGRGMSSDSTQKKANDRSLREKKSLWRLAESEKSFFRITDHYKFSSKVNLKRPLALIATVMLVEFLCSWDKLMSWHEKSGEIVLET
jgi:hypothetical protein